MNEFYYYQLLESYIAGNIEKIKKILREMSDTEKLETQAVFKINNLNDLGIYIQTTF